MLKLIAHSFHRVVSVGKVMQIVRERQCMWTRYNNNRAILSQTRLPACACTPIWYLREKSTDYGCADRCTTNHVDHARNKNLKQTKTAQHTDHHTINRGRRTYGLTH